jgi:hypothetical protein
MNRKLLHFFAFVIFLLGILLGFSLSAIAIWNRTEAVNYFFTGAKYDPFPGLRCPAFIAPTEQATVRALFKNPTNEEDTFYYRTEISGTPSTRRLENQIAVPPHQTKSIQLTVNAQDVDLLFFIFVKVDILPNAVHSSQEAVCGIMVANILGLAGVPLATLAISLSFLGIAIGWTLWQKTSTRADRNAQRVLQALGLIVLLAMFVGAMGWWLAGVALCAIALLLLVISLRFIISE